MRLIFGILLFLCSLCGYATDTLIINVARGSQQFVVSLPSNPTTGYQWGLTAYDKKILRMVDSHFIAPETKLIGAGGKMTFTFALVKPQSPPHNTSLLFTYARSWEPKSGTLKHVTVNFIKKGK
jgi:inhibitor of cysteine peptidase